MPVHYKLYKLAAPSAVQKLFRAVLLPGLPETLHTMAFYFLPDAGASSLYTVLSVLSFWLCCVPVTS